MQQIQARPEDGWSYSTTKEDVAIYVRKVFRMMMIHTFLYYALHYITWMSELLNDITLIHDVGIIGHKIREALSTEFVFYYMPLKVYV